MENNRHSAGRRSAPDYEDYLYSGGAAAELFRESLPRYVPPVPVAHGGEGALVDRIPASTTAIIKTLGESIVTEIVVPMIRLGSRAECVEFMAKNWHSFCETLGAFHVLIARVSSEEKAIELAERSSVAIAESIERAAQALHGAEAVDEAAFALGTYRSATSLIRKFRELPAPGDRNRDRTLARGFSQSASMYTLAATALVVAAEQGGTEAAVAWSFELLRGSAIDAYAAAREAYELRAPDVGHPEDEAVDISNEEHQLAEAGLERPHA
jgi:hypothetical protein